MSSVIRSLKKSFDDVSVHVKRMKQHQEEKEAEMGMGSKLLQVRKGGAKNKIVMDVSATTIAKAIAMTMLIVGIAYLLYQIRDILVLFFVSLLFAAALDPMVDSMERRRIPRWLAVVFIYIGFFLILTLFLTSFIPILATELKNLADSASAYVTNVLTGEVALPAFLEGARPFIQEILGGIDAAAVKDYKDVLLGAASQLTSVAENAVSAVVALFNGLFNTVLVLVLTFIMAIDEHGIDKFILSLFPSRHARYITEKSAAIKSKIGYWLRGQVLLSVSIGILTYIGFFVISLLGMDIEYSATLALFAGFAEVIPYAGPAIAWVAAVIIAANHSLSLVIAVTILFFIVQQLENNVLVPVIMHKVVGLSSIFVIMALLIGYEFLGILGMVLSVPVATTVALFVRDYADREK